MMFRKAFDPVVVVPASSGCKYRMRRCAKRDRDGQITLVDLEEVNQYEEIQSFRDGCDVSKILARYRATGDPSVLKVRSGVYADVSGFPLDFAEANRMLAGMSATFDSLPDDVRGGHTFGDICSRSDLVGPFLSRMAKHLSGSNTEVPNSSIDGGAENA